jgi:hypothetical protein
MTVETIERHSDTPNVKSRQATSPSYLRGTFTLDDGDNHDFKVDGRGKGRMTVCADVSTSNQTVTVSVYGMHGIGDDVGDAGVVQIGSSFTVTDANDIGYETVNDVFPFYLIRLAPASSASGSPTCTLYVNLSAF